MAAPKGKDKFAPIIVRDKQAVSKIRRWNRRRFPGLSYSRTVAEIVEQWESQQKEAK